MASKRSVQQGIGKAIGYIRVSTKSQSENGHSIDGQKARLIERCKTEGLELIDLIVEVECSTKERELLNTVQRRLTDGEAQVLVCAKFDRIGRSQIHLARIVEWAVENNIDILSADEGWQVKAGKKVNKMLPFIIAFAEVELERIRDRTREGLEAAKAKGKKLGHAPVNVELSKRIYEMRVGGMGWRQIVKQLEDEDVRTAQGCKVALGNAYNMAGRWARENGLEMPSGRVECSGVQ